MSNRRKSAIPAKKVKAPTRLVVLNPSKGLNTLVSSSLIDDREFSDSFNIEYDEGGVARKRSGYVSVANALTAARGLGRFVTESLRYLVTVDSGTIKYLDTSTTVWSSATGVTITPATDVNFCQARDKLYIWNGADGGTYFDGTTVTKPGTMPKATFSIFYQNKHIASGVPGQPNRLYISNISDASDFTVTTGGTAPQPENVTEVPGATVFTGTPGLSEANLIDVRKNDGDRITGLGKFKDMVVIFKERSIYQLTFDASGNPAVVPITESTGCVSHRSIEAVENDLYFLSREGVRSLGNEANYNDAIRTTVLSLKVQPTVAGINYTYFSKVNAHYWDNKYIMAVPTSSSSIDHCIVTDRRFQAWSYWDLAPQSMLLYTDSSNKEHFYFLNSDGTRVFEVSKGTYSDNGAAISAYLVSKSQDFGNPDITKRWVDLGLIFRRLSGTADLTVYEDNGNTVGSVQLGGGTRRGMGRIGFGRAYLGSDGQAPSTTQSFSDNPLRVGLNLNSRTLKFKISNSNLNENFVFLGMVYSVYPYSHYLFDSTRKVYL